VAQIGTLLRGQKFTGPAAVAALVNKSQGLGMEITPLRIENRTSADAEVHAAEEDIFYVLDGAAAFHLGGTLHDTWEYSPGNQAGHEQRDATEYVVGAGDVVVIPRGTVHRITCPDGFVEVLMIKRLEN
jgi:quercetin dioxygenase-like cupin family protein